MIKIAIGFDQREAVAYHTFVQSVLTNTKETIVLIPLKLNNINSYFEKHNDGSNEFIYSRFLTPFINQFTGWCIFADGDMICNNDIIELWNLRDSNKAVHVVKHDYKTKFKNKYLGNKNENYPRKNWSSLILWNCEHKKNKILTPEFISNKDGKFLHRFSWLEDEDIGSIDISWNWLVSEYDDNEEAKLLHYTIGTPCFNQFKNSNHSDLWYKYYNLMIEGINK